MTPLTYAPKDATPRSAPVRFLFRHNPFYLLSAMCMLAGCLALTNSLSWTSIPLPRLLALIATLNLYEGLLLALGLYLLARRGSVRDGLMLLVLEAVFLVDSAFLNVEVFALDLGVGIAANAMIYLLAVAKLYVVFRVTGLPRDRMFAFVLAQLTVLFVTPGLFAALSKAGDGSLPPSLAYAAWWALGILAAASTFLVRWGESNDKPSTAAARVPLFVRRTFVALPFASLLLHLLMMHWVYEAHVHAAYFAPLLLGVAIAIQRAAPSRVANASDLVFLRIALPALAVAVSLDAPADLRLAPFGPAARLIVTPLALSLAAAYLAYVYLFVFRHALYFLGAGFFAVLTYALGPTPAQVAAGVAGGWEWALTEARRLVPKTTAGWGVVGVGAAFVFLAAGAAISLRKPPAEEAAAASPVPVDDGNAYG